MQITQTLWDSLMSEMHMIRSHLVSLEHKVTTQMLDTTKILAAVSRGNADSKVLIAIATDTSKQLTEAATKIDALSAQLAAGGDTKPVQDALDKMADDLNAESDLADAAIAARQAQTGPKAP